MKPEDDLKETRTALDLIKRTKAKVDGALEKSRKRIDWVNSCVNALAANESFLRDGSFSAKSTTEKFKRNRGTASESCATLWDPAVARTPITDVLKSELFQSRLYQALGENWGKPQEASMTVEKPTIQGDFFEDLPEKLEPLSEFEKGKIVETRDRLLKDCIRTGQDECLEIDGLQTYAKKRYKQITSESPILLYFTKSLDARQAIPSSEIASAYKKHQTKMAKLLGNKLSDQDYLQFPFFLDEAISELPQNQRGDYCDVAGAMLENLKDKENFDTGVMLVGVTYGGLQGMAAKGVLGRLFAFLGATAHSTNIYLVSQVVSHYEIMNKIEATCSQSHLRMPELCNVDTIRGNAQSIIVDGVSLGASGLMSAFSLFGPATRMLTKVP